jgi:hypothetical protein
MREIYLKENSSERKDRSTASTVSRNVFAAAAMHSIPVDGLGSGGS